MNNAGKYGCWAWAVLAVSCGGGQSFDDGRDGVLQGNVRQTQAGCTTDCDAPGDATEGDADGNSAADDPASLSPESEVPAQVAPLSECADADAQYRAPYEDWLAQPNDFAELTGKTFAGYVEGGPDLTLAIDEEGNASLVVGAPAPAPEGDNGYLCDEATQSRLLCNYETPIEGGTYPLRGATFGGERLVAPVQPNAPFDAWCAMQIPHDTGDCNFAALTNDTVSWSPSHGEPPSESACSVGDDSVDCGWFDLLFNNYPCTCISTECFAAMHAPTSVSIDARYDAETGEISGSFVRRGSTVPIHLFERRLVPDTR